ncbi:MAG: acyltransferase family protein, partial [Caulobacteraceae bacterium]
LGPLTEFFVAHSWGGRSFPRAYGHYLASGEVFSGTGPLWFCAALIVFSGAYAVWRLVTAGAGRLPAPRPIRAWGVAAAVAALALSTFAVRLVVPMGAAVFNMQLGDFPSYILLFALGVTAARGGWLEATSARFAWRGAGVCVGAAMAMWLPLLVLGGALQGKSTVFSGGFQWQSAGLCLWESLICVGMSFAVMAAFRGRLAGQGRFCKFMSDNAFAVYVIHPPILIALALAMAGIALPPAEKFALLWVASLVASFGLAAPAARRIPLLGSILK